MKTLLSQGFRASIDDDVKQWRLIERTTSDTSLSTSLFSALAFRVTFFSPGTYCQHWSLLTNPFFAAFLQPHSVSNAHSQHSSLHHFPFVFPFLFSGHFYSTPCGEPSNMHGQEILGLISNLASTLFENSSLRYSNSKHLHPPFPVHTTSAQL